MVATGAPPPELVTVFDISLPTPSFQVLNPGADKFSDVAVSGDTLVIGASVATGGGLGPTGKVYVFDYSGGVWVRGPELQPTDLTPGARFGAAVDLEGNRLLVGAPTLKKPSGLKVGGFYLFERVGQTWVEVGRHLGAGAQAPEFGLALSLEGERVRRRVLPRSAVRRRRGGSFPMLRRR